MTAAVPHREWRPFDDRSPSSLRDLFAPLPTLLASGGDSRLAIDPVTGLNEYGCSPQPGCETRNFASSTASSISLAAYERVEIARQELMQQAIVHGLEHAFETRIEAMREELGSHLRLAASEANVVFAPSGTDAQLHALFMARAVHGAALVTIVVGSDQSGSGTIYTARGRHFSSVTASDVDVRKGGAIAGLEGDSIGVSLADATADIAPRGDVDGAVLGAVDAAVAGGRSVLLQVMDSSKLGWHAPSQACLDEITRRFPGKVQVVVDACQMRLGRRRLRAYLDRGYLVQITGSKFFGGPAFSGALLVPSAFSRSIDGEVAIPRGFFDYAARSDWPGDWTALRSRFDSRLNFGQSLRWEAALEEIAGYYAVPDAFRANVLTQLEAGIESMIAQSPALRAIRAPMADSGPEDEEFAHATIFPFALEADHGLLSADGCRMIYRALAQDMSETIGATEADRRVAAQCSLVGQPVRLDRPAGTHVGLLRLCVGARLVTEAWKGGAMLAEERLQCILDRIADVIVKIELVLARERAEQPKIMSGV